MNLDQAKAVSRDAIVPMALDREGDAWWGEGAREVEVVVCVPDTASAAAHIEWWHASWRAIGNTPVRGATPTPRGESSGIRLGEGAGMRSTRAGQGEIKTQEEKRKHELRAGSREERAWRRQYGRIANEVENDRERSREPAAPAAHDVSDA